MALLVFADEAHCATVNTLGALHVVGKCCAGRGILDFTEVPGVHTELG